MYHIYNQGNNRQLIFSCDQDYLEFLRLFRKYVVDHGKVLAWCLMPNHFHFLMYANEDSAKPKRLGNIDTCMLSNGFRLLLSKYAQYLNKMENRSGSLFRQKMKAKAVSGGSEHYGFVAFQYIHQNPLKAGLVQKIEDWLYSSFADFAGKRSGTLCDKVLAEQLIAFNTNNFVDESYKAIDEEVVKNIFDRNSRSAP